MSSQTLQDKHQNPVAESLRFNIEIGVPGILSLSSYHTWASYLIDKPQWAGALDGVGPLADLTEDARVFISSHLELWRVFFDLGRLPILDMFEIKSCVLKDPVSRVYSLEVDFLKVDFVPLVAYEIAITVSLRVTQWLAAERVRDKSLASLYKTIEEDVTAPMRRLVPGGDSTIPVLAEAYRQRIPFAHLGQGIYQLGWGSRSSRLDRGSSALDSVTGARLSQNKASAAHLLRSAGLPAPDHILVYGERDTIDAAKVLGYPVVVKPVDEDRGEGVAVGVSDEVSLKRAFAVAQYSSRSKQVLVERQVEGVCHRLVIVGGQLLYAVKRRPMGVIGDGALSVAQLVDRDLAIQSKRPPWLRSKLLGFDVLAEQTLSAAGLGQDHIPCAGEFVPLRPFESTRWGGVDEDITSTVHPDNVSAAARAARLMNLHIAGVDLITTDITLPWHLVGGVINEVNFAPLLGGAEISRSYLPQFFRLLAPGIGPIPIEVFDEESLARDRLRFFYQQNLRAFFISASGVEGPKGERVFMPINEVRLKVRALMLHQDVDAVVVLL